MAKSKKENESETLQDTEQVPEPEKKANNKEKNNTKYTLLELVRQSKDKFETYIGLTRSGLDEQYLVELERDEKGLENIPTLTLTEFEKIIK